MHKMLIALSTAFVAILALTGASFADSPETTMSLASGNDDPQCGSQCD